RRALRPLRGAVLHARRRRPERERLHLRGEGGTAGGLTPGPPQGRPPQLVNCSASIRSSRLCSGSNSRVTVRSRDSRIVTSTTSRTSCESAAALTGRLYGSTTWKRISVSALSTAPRQRRGRNAAIGVSATTFEPSGRIGPCAEKL